MTHESGKVFWVWEKTVRDFERLLVRKGEFRLWREEYERGVPGGDDRGEAGGDGSDDRGE